VSCPHLLAGVINPSFRNARPSNLAFERRGGESTSWQGHQSFRKATVSFGRRVNLVSATLTNYLTADENQEGEGGSTFVCSEDKTCHKHSDPKLCRATHSSLTQLEMDPVSWCRVHKIFIYADAAARSGDIKIWWMGFWGSQRLIEMVNEFICVSGGRLSSHLLNVLCG